MKNIDYAWLQVSDIHIFENTEWDLIQEAYKNLQYKDYIKFIVVTGDLHQYGEDYNKTGKYLEKLLDLLNLSKKDIFIVPGNHDSGDCYMKEEIIRIINEDVKDAQDCYLKYFVKGKLVDCFNDYNKFIKSFYGVIYADFYKEPEQVTVKTWNNRINIIHLNTAINCMGNNEFKVIVDIKKLRDLGKELNKKCPSIIIAHHPFDKIHDLHRNILRRYITDWNVSAYLCGDLHKEVYTHIYTHHSSDSNIPCIVCGKTAPEDSDVFSDLGCVIYLKGVNSNSIEVLPFIWNKQKKHFAPYTEFNNDSGNLVFKLLIKDDFSKTKEQKKVSTNLSDVIKANECIDSTNIKNYKVIKSNRINGYVKKLKIWLFFIIAIVFFYLFYFFQNTEVEEKTIYWDGSKSVTSNYGGGSGTAEDPYIIDSAEQLAELAYVVNKGIDYKNTYFKLVSDIHLNNIDDKGEIEIPNSNNIIANINLYIWTPIGSIKHPFNGNNKKVTGLYIVRDDVNIENSYQGLFGYCSEESIISDLTLQDISVDGAKGRYIGGLCGKMDGLIDSCFVERAWVFGGSSVGGIVGEGNIIVNCGVAAYIADSYNWGAVFAEEIEISEDTFSNRGCFGGIAGRCNYLINSVSYTRIQCPTYKVGSLAGEIICDMYNCVCDEVVVEWEDYNKFIKYYNYIYDNKLEFLYCDVIGSWKGESNKKVKKNNIFIIDPGGVYISFYDERVQAEFEKKFSALYNNIDIKNFENNNVCILNHDYSFEMNQYNMITETTKYAGYEDEFVERLNDNLEINNIFNTDINDILYQYGVAGGRLELKIWLPSDQDMPVLEGMDMTKILWRGHM